LDIRKFTTSQGGIMESQPVAKTSKVWVESYDYATRIAGVEHQAAEWFAAWRWRHYDWINVQTSWLIWTGRS
jgi:hypothetical protein